MFEDTDVKAFFTTNSDGNIAYHVVDEKDYKSVDEARLNLGSKYGINISKLKHMDQVHSCDVKIVSDEQDLYRCDALITNKKNTPLMIMSADCIGILFYDSIKKVIAVAHAGRNGTFLNISSKVISTLIENFDSKAKDIKIVLGPSIGICCYEVSQEMVDIVEKNFGKKFVKEQNIDLQGINKKQLLDMGVKEDNITISSICTKCNGEEYFSYRNDKTCGRFAGVIELN